MKRSSFEKLVLLLCCCFYSSSTTAAAFAAAKKKKTANKQQAKTSKGFGTAPPTFEETLAQFESRAPIENADSIDCPCGSSLSYNTCCQPYHLYSKQPTSPLAVLQSRYTAFKFRNIGYIIATTHPSCRDYQPDKITWAKDLNKRGMFDSYTFEGLEVLKEENNGDSDEAFIEFQVTLKERNNNDPKTTIIQERSKFLRDSDTKIWSYASGDVRSTNQGLEDIQLNA
jgi:SEC-C motif-containing protein